MKPCSERLSRALVSAGSPPQSRSCHGGHVHERNLWVGAALVAFLIAAAQSAPSAMAATVPFTEDFSSDSANWRDAAGVNPLGWVSTGGPDGGAFARGTFSFASSGVQDTPAVFRGQSSFGSSGGAFVGDWLGGGVTEFRALVRHDAPTDLTFFGRFASPFNFPAMVAVFPSVVSPHEWTPISVLLAPSNFIAEGPSTFNGVFGNVGNVQLGVLAGPLAGSPGTVTFDLDKVRIVPEPATLSLLVLGSWLALRRRERRSGGP